MGTKHKKYEARLKAKIACDALKGESSILTLCTEHNIPKTNVLEWRDKLIAESEKIFIPISEQEKKERQLKQELESMKMVIAELTMENKFFKKKLLK